MPVREDFVWPKRWVRRASKSYVWAYEQTRALIAAQELSCIVVFNGRFTHENAAAAAAHDCGVKVLYFDYGGSDTRFDLTFVSTHDWDFFQKRMVDMWASWDDDRYKIANYWFESRENHSAPGMDAFVGHQQIQHLPQLPSVERLVVFFSSSGDEIAELDIDWSLYFESQENALLTLAEVCDSLPGTELVVRTHPHMLSKSKDDLDRWIKAVMSIGRNIHIAPEDPTDSYSLMQVADRVVTYGSTTGVEAALKGKAVATMGPCAYDQLGCCTALRTREELAAWLQAPPNLDPEMALPYGLMMQRRGFNWNWLREGKSGGIYFGDLLLAESSQTSRKLSHLSQSFTTQWLLR